MASKRAIVLVTGGNNGIGFETCRLFASQNKFHVIMGSRSIEKGEKALQSIQEENQKSSISLVQIDITKDESISTAYKQIESKWGKLDVLINNAAICPVDYNRNTLREAIEVNCISPGIVTSTFAPLLKKAVGIGRIIYVSSAIGSITNRANPNGGTFPRNHDYKSYRISKAALNMLIACETWQYEEDCGILVFAFDPGYVVSDLAGIRQQKINNGVRTPELSAQGLMDIALGKRDNEKHSLLHNNPAGPGIIPW